MSASGSGDKSGSNSVDDKVKQLIKDHKVIVFSKTHCPYCKKAKKYLGNYKIKDFKVLELDEIDDGDDYLDVLGKMTGAYTVPRVFIDGEFIGGGDDTEKLEKQGELEKN